jgi:CHAD domain-containing protein
LRRTEAKAHEAAESDAEFRETMRVLIAERWAAVWEAIPVALAGEDIEGVHDVRVASRRLRAAMDVAVPVFPRPWYKSLHRTAKEITGALGEVRDRDVLLEALRADRAEAPLVEHPGLDRLIDRVERERVEARREMEAYLEELVAGPVRGEVERRFGSVTGDPNVVTSEQELL